MNKLIITILILALMVPLNEILKAQNSDNLKNGDKQKLSTPYIPDKSPRAPVGNLNSIPFISKSNSAGDNPASCLKIPWDSAFIVHPFDGLGCNGPADSLDPLQRNDDDVTLAIPLPFVFNLYGTNYTSVYINNNGNLTFNNDFCEYTPFAFPSAAAAMVAPFFADVDTRNLLSGVVWMKMEPNRLTVIWDSVGYYNINVDKLNKFEVIITDGTDPLIGIGNNVCFSYSDMEWTTGDASGGIGGFYGAPATVGVNKGDSISFATLGRFDRPGTYYGGPSVDTNGVSYLDCQTFSFRATNASNICPVASGFPIEDTVIVDPAPYIATYSMSAPETDQIVTGSVSGVPQGMTVNITNGLTCNFDVTFIPECDSIGFYEATVIFTGVDNAADPCTTIVSVEFEWECPLPVELSSFASTVSGRNVLLEWTTTEELNNLRFDIERATDNNWTTIGSVNGRGTTNSPQYYSFRDRNLNSGSYNYRLKQIDYNGNQEYFNLSNEVVIGIPERFELGQNYPNPFNPVTTIDYSIPVDGKVSLSIFDAAGREVSRLVNMHQYAGYYSVNFNASNLSSGIYFYRIEIRGLKNFIDSRKMLLMK